MLQMWYKGVTESKWRGKHRQLRCYRCNKLDHVARNCSGKCIPGQGIVTNFVPCKTVNVTLPVVGNSVDFVQCSALVDTRCSWSTVSAHRCRLWRKQCMAVINTRCCVSSILWSWISYNSHRAWWLWWSWRSDRAGKTYWLWFAYWDRCNTNIRRRFDYPSWRSAARQKDIIVCINIYWIIWLMCYFWSQSESRNCKVEVGHQLSYRM